MPDLVKVLIQDALKRAIDYYGVEGASEAITRVYVRHLVLRDAMLEELNKRFIKNN